MISFKDFITVDYTQQGGTKADPDYYLAYLSHKRKGLDLEEVAEITKANLDAVEKYADKLFSKVGIDVEFTRHFLDRVNDERNKKQITTPELVRLFKKTYAQYGKKIANLGPDAEAVLNDIKTDVNMPFVLKWDRKNQEFDMVAKTVMRKKDFKTPDQKLVLSSYGYVAEGVAQDQDIKDRKGSQPKKYYDSEMSKSTKEKRAAHFAKRKSGKAPGDASAKTKPSKHTLAYKRMYGELTEKEIAGLRKKADASGIDYSILKDVYDRGMGAWETGHRPGATQQQWAYARVNSFITGGKTRTTADSDLWKKHKGVKESDFKAHWMYDPKTGEKKWAETEDDHNKLSGKGWGHEPV